MPLVVVRHPVFAASLFFTASFWFFNCPDSPTAPPDAPVPTAIAFTPPTLVVDSRAVATVSLSGPAPAQGLQLAVRVEPGGQFVEAPATVFAPAGSATAQFTLTPKAALAAFGLPTLIRVQVEANGTVLTATPAVAAAVEPAPPLRLTAIALDNDDVTCGGAVSGTLSLNRPVATDDPRALLVRIDSVTDSTTPVVTVVAAGTVSQRFRVVAPATGRDEDMDVVAYFSHEGGGGVGADLTVYGCLSLLAVAPAEAPRGGVVDVTLTGFNIRAPLTLQGEGLSVSNVQRVSSSRVTARVTVDGDAATGPRRLYLETPTGTAWVYFNVLPGAGPSVTSISPDSGGTGFSVPVTITGTNFAAGATVAISGAGVTVSGVAVVNSTTITATLQIAESAPVGARSVTVTTADGTSNAVTFTIIP